MTDDRTRFVWTNGAYDVRLVCAGRPAVIWTALLFRAGDDVDPVDSETVWDCDKFFGAKNVLDDLLYNLLHGVDSAAIDAVKQALAAWKDGRNGWMEVVV